MLAWRNQQLEYKMEGDEEHNKEKLEWHQASLGWEPEPRSLMMARRTVSWKAQRSIYDMLDLYVTIEKIGIIMILCLLTMKALNHKSSQVKKTLERDSLVDLKWLM